MRDFNDDREQMEFLRKYNERQYERRKKMRKRVGDIIELIIFVYIIGQIVMAVLSLVLK
jgi:hypothetical protein